jgi:hypothetical protein
VARLRTVSGDLELRSDDVGRAADRYEIESSGGTGHRAVTGG